MVDGLVARPRCAVQVQQGHVVEVGQGGLGAAQRGPLGVHVCVLVERHVHDVGGVDLLGHGGQGLVRLVVAPELAQAIRLDLHETAHERLVGAVAEAGQGVVDDHEADIRLAQVGACARGDEDQLDLLGELHASGAGRVNDLDCFLGVAEPPLGIRLNGAQGVVPAHAAHSAHLPQRLLVAPRGIGRQSRSLPDHVDAPGARHSGLGVLVSLLWIQVDELSGHHQMAGNDIAVRPGQGLQRDQGLGVELLGGHARRDRRSTTVP